jgi:hypothetical protein
MTMGERMFVAARCSFFVCPCWLVGLCLILLEGSGCVMLSCISEMPGIHDAVGFGTEVDHNDGWPRYVLVLI